MEARDQAYLIERSPGRNILGRPSKRALSDSPTRPAGLFKGGLCADAPAGSEIGQTVGSVVADENFLDEKPPGPRAGVAGYRTSYGAGAKVGP